jgi:hypothetical protein
MDGVSVVIQTVISSFQGLNKRPAGENLLHVISRKHDASKINKSGLFCELSSSSSPAGDAAAADEEDVCHSSASTNVISRLGNASA